MATFVDSPGMGLVVVELDEPEPQPVARKARALNMEGRTKTPGKRVRAPGERTDRLHVGAFLVANSGAGDASKKA